MWCSCSFRLFLIPTDHEGVAIVCFFYFCFDLFIAVETEEYSGRCFLSRTGCFFFFPNSAFFRGFSKNAASQSYPHASRGGDISLLRCRRSFFLYVLVFLAVVLQFTVSRLSFFAEPLSVVVILASPFAIPTCRVFEVKVDVILRGYTPFLEEPVTASFFIMTFSSGLWSQGTTLHIYYEQAIPM